MSKPTILRRAIRYMYRNGYWKPEGDGKARGSLLNPYHLPEKIRRALVVLRGLYFDRRFDRKHRVDTSGAVYLRELDIDSESVRYGELYDPLPQRSFKHVMRFLPDGLSDYSFVDFGSGKGRILLMASEYGFKKIIGVEFSQQLHDIAVENIKSYRSRTQRCADIESRHIDAVRFEVPNGKCVFFLFASFRGQVLRSVLENIRQSYLRDPRHMIMLFVTGSGTHPVPWADFREMGVLREVCSGDFPFDPAKRYPIEYVVLETVQ